MIDTNIKVTGIALIGEKGCGKSTTANALLPFLDTFYGTSGIKLSFADSLRREVATMLVGSLDTKPVHLYMEKFETIINEMSDPSTKEFYRPLLKWWGTEWRRTTNPDYWVDQVKHRIDSLAGLEILLATQPILFVVDDCRFQNEYDMLKDNNFLFFNLSSNPNRPKDPQDYDTHKSEQDWRHFYFDDYVGWDTVDVRVAAIINSIMRREGRNTNVLS